MYKYLFPLFILFFSSPAYSIINNNPGNLVKTNITWKGEVKCSSRFECFRTKEHGLRAMVINLRTYRDRYKLDTIPKIITRWSPSNENDTERLIINACSYTDSDCSSTYNLHIRHNFKTLILALLRQEHSKIPVPVSMIDRVIDKYVYFSQLDREDLKNFLQYKYKGGVWVVQKNVRDVMRLKGRTPTTKLLVGRERNHGLHGVKNATVNTTENGDLIPPHRRGIWREGNYL